MKCYLCDSENFNKRKGAVRDNPNLEILECANCGLVTLSSIQHINDVHYENSGMHGDELPSIESWLQEGEQDDQRRFDMLKPVLVNRKILDFGCGAAGFIHKAKYLAKEAVGVELESRVRERSSDEISIYSNLDEADIDFDLITAFHVVEHLPDPLLILKKMASHLNSNGRIIIEVPNSEDALLTLYDSDAFQRFTYWSQHLFLFSDVTLNKLAKQAGLRVISIKQVQRYPISNHLYWLSRDKAGGHEKWSFLDNKLLSEAYESSLAAIGKCDTIIAYLEKE